ncbi:MAG: CoA activase [Deltaproteobacteria bacterium GWC2_42_11]|nr:MAG: CoA activase [Deltaproteobacteria bacterium GWC2_42_11]
MSHNSPEVFIGIDIGSVSTNTVVVTLDKEILEEHYTRTKGQPLETARDVLADVLSRYPIEIIRVVAATGTGGKTIAPLIGAYFTNEVIAQSKAVEYFHPDVRTVIEMGGEDAKLILLAPDDTAVRSQESGVRSKKIRVEDFAMNSVCAAGTGSFLDQQATRLGLTIEQFGELALKSKNPPRVAGRCSVFAKSDMIHLQQAATPDYDIVAGLCYAVARNFKSTIGRGKTFLKPVAFQGGVAANPGVRKAFRDVLELNDDEFIIPERFTSMGALGAVFTAMEKTNKMPSHVSGFKGLKELEEYIASGRKKGKGIDPLSRPENHPSQKKDKSDYWGQIILSPLEKVNVYLGIDIGSVSTNVILIDEHSKLIARRYLSTAGRPIEAVRQGLKEIGEECGDKVNVIGAGTTGSGRYLIGDFVGADCIRNEITAQATAAAHIDPTVDTIFEIGGQDSKYIALKDSVVVDFEMNKVCAAGTGSFLEEQAERLGISIENEFSNLALLCTSPASMGERCTVFIESDMVHHQQSGAKKDELVAGLSYSIVHNYLNRVVGDRRIGNNIFFQGGTAANLGVVSAFEIVTGKKITVPENHDVTGAIGVAILVMKEKDRGKPTHFKGFDLSKKKYTLTSFECRDCANICDIKQVTVEGEKPLYYGSRCEKYDINRASAKDNPLPDLFKEREKALFSSYKGKRLPNNATSIGVPRALFIYEMYPFWKAFFNELGYKVILSSPTNREVIKDGVERVVAETCYPIKIAHGHVQDLINKGVKKIFIPSIINLKPAKEGHTFTYHCPYVQTMPYLTASAFDFKALDVEVLKPVIHFNKHQKYMKSEFYELGKMLDRKKGDIDRALDTAWSAQKKFHNSRMRLGEEALKKLKPGEIGLVIVGRPYNTMDNGINLELPQKLRDMNIMAIPFDMLPLDEAIDDAIATDVYWRSGQRIIAAAKVLRDMPNLYAVYITNFGCGPDSFITHFFKDMSNGKPFLQLEIDEHSADAGAVTRCEAFIDSLRNIRNRGQVSWSRGQEKQAVHRTGLKKKIYLPNMADAVHAMAAAFQSCGLDAEVIPEPDDETLKWGRRYTSGRECYPCIITTGDMVKITKRDGFDAEKSAFFMPSGNGPCRFGKYNRYHRLVLDELGYNNVPIYAPDQDEAFYKELGMVGGNFSRLSWWGIVAIDTLEKKLREIRPYEKNPGETEEVYWKCLHRICDAIRERRFPEDELKQAKRELKKVTVYKSEGKPIIGIVGEIYVRSNRFSNSNLVKQLEALGAEVRMPPIAEWIYYTNHCSKKRNWERGHYSNYLRTKMNDFFQRKDEHRTLNILDGDLRGGHEPETREIMNLASPYIHESFEGEAILSVGKAMDYIRKGTHGIVNAMPFTCMPGTVVNAILKKVREENNNIPYINMVYEGLEDTNSKSRLEAFMYQAKEYMERK